MTVAAEFLQVQNGIATGKSLTPGAALYLHDGRGLAAYTHDDVLYQSYFMAYLVLNTINDGEPAPLNPGNPYVCSKTQNGFGTMGQPDIAATLTAVAREAINAVWYHKWWVHLRHRPESGGAIVHLQKTGQSGSILGARQQHGPSVEGGTEELHPEQQLFSLAGLPGGLTNPSVVSDRARRGSWRLHHGLEVLLRWHLHHQETNGAIQRWNDPQRLCGALGRAAAQRQR